MISSRLSSKQLLRYCSIVPHCMNFAGSDRYIPIRRAFHATPYLSVIRPFLLSDIGEGEWVLVL